MTIRELVNTCQNQWGGSVLGKNKDFKFDVINCDKEVTYYFNVNYLDDDNWYLIEDEKVEYWRFENGILTIGFNIWRSI